MMRDLELCPGCFLEPLSETPCRRCGYRHDPSLFPSALRPGTVLTRYVLGRVLGKPGGFGITYLAYDPVLKRRLAIKELMPRELVARQADGATLHVHTREDEETFKHTLTSFLNEARLVAQLSHPNVVRVLDFFEGNGTAYFAMEYYEGETLAEYVRRAGGRLPGPEAVSLMLPLLDALEHLHSLPEPILHRDIKPANIYLTGNRRPILLDFGAARVALRQQSRSLSAVLTPGYAPYEQYSTRGKQGPWSDVYACAATLHYVVTGRVPREASERVEDPQLEPPSALAPDLSTELSDAIVRGLGFRPEDRPQTAKAFADLLSGRELPTVIVADRRPAGRATDLATTPVDQTATVPARPQARPGDTTEAAPQTTVPAPLGAVPAQPSPSPPPPPPPIPTPPLPAAQPAPAAAQAPPSMEQPSNPIVAAAIPTAKPRPGYGRPAVLTGAALVVIVLVGAAALAWMWQRGTTLNEPDGATSPATVASDAASVPSVPALEGAAGTSAGPPPQDRSLNGGPGVASEPASQSPAETTPAVAKPEPAPPARPVNPPPEAVGPAAPRSAERRASPPTTPRRAAAPPPTQPPPPEPARAEPALTKVLVVIRGSDPAEVQQTESTILRALVGRGGLQALDANGLAILRANQSAVQSAVLGEFTDLASLSRQYGVELLVVGELKSRAVPSINRFYTGTADLNVGMYRVSSGQLVAGQTFTVGQGGAQPVLAVSDDEARSRAVAEAARAAAEGVGSWLGRAF